MYDHEKLCAEIRSYLADFSESGFSQTRFAQVADIVDMLAGGKTPFHTVVDTFECCDIERAATALGFAALTDAAVSEQLYRMFGCSEGSITPRMICELFCGSDNVCTYAELFSDRSEKAALQWIFSGVKSFHNAVMRLRPSLARFILFGECREEYVSLLQNDPSKEYVGLDKSIEAVGNAISAYNGENLVTVCMVGEHGCGKKTVLALAAERLGISFALIDHAALNNTPVEELAALLTVTDVYPVVLIGGIDDIDNNAGSKIYDFLNKLSDYSGLTAVISEQQPDDKRLRADLYTIKPSIPEELRGLLWREKSKKYNTDGGIDLNEIASEFDLTPGAVEKALRYAAAASDGTLSASDIKRGCYRSLAANMGGKAVRVNTAFKWDDLILPDHSKSLLRTACDRVRNAHRVYDKWGFGKRLPYGRGISMIFTGPPGTGKTMAAQVVAEELGLELYKVNLAAVVSKYVGETEKNLNEIFDRAAKSRVILFFDEADVLFGKRTEVKDSNDKYSNMEAAFLLQKIENYGGIVILATNFIQNFDEAFKRRIDFPVEFPFPGKEQRRELWKNVFPPETPVGKLDYDYLAENFELSGSNIKNIAVHSAFLAAATQNSDSPQVEMKHIIPAIRNEFAKSGKAFTKSEAGEYSDYLEK